MKKFVNGVELAVLLKLTPPRVTQLVKEKVLTQGNDGKYEVTKAIEQYYLFKFRKDLEPNFQREHAGLEKAKCEKAELELKELKNSLLYASDVEKGMHDMIVRARATFDPLPERCASKVIGEKDIGVIVETLRTEVYAALNELNEMPEI